MPVPTLITDLSTTIASNSPAGSESVTSTDDYLRALAAFVAQLRDGVGFGSTLALTGVTLRGGTSGTGYSFSGSAPATSLALNSSGNLGIGVTPSAWRAGAYALQVGGFASLNTQQNGTVTLAFGAYESGSNTFSYLTTGDSPTAYSQLTGAHKWFTAPSGTAGNPITFTQAMTLDASGNLTANTGNIVQGTAAKGINFTANTPAAGMTSRLLNWYEEGTWTPSYATWTTAPTNVYAKYVRIGSQVTVTILALNGVNGGGQNITGLPFTSGNSASSGTLSKVNAATVTSFCIVADASSTISAITAVTFTGFYWALTVTYFV